VDSGYSIKAPELAVVLAADAIAKERSVMKFNIASHLSDAPG